MIQDILAEPEWAQVLGDADRRGLTPLFHTNMTPYGEVKLHMTTRLALAEGQLAPEDRAVTPMPATVGE